MNFWNGLVMADLSSELSKRTESNHKQSNKLINLKLLFVATDRKLWRKIIANFYFIFKAIEEEILYHKDHERLWCLYIPGLLRKKAFEEDLLYYYGEQWSSLVSPSPATKDFVDHIHAVVEKNPMLLVTYSHTFYLALMAGGKIVRSIVTKSLRLKNGLGTSALEFKSESAVKLKKNLKDTINSLGVDCELKEQLVQEKIVAFNMVNAIVKEIKLEPSSFMGIIKLLLLLLAPLIVAYLIYQIWVQKT
ncbi:heme oxygenase-like [Xenia sp. Carnegie-2017]|uniref:heme oxygenase-like n=1 Tax=Xenia sp. Carnegie-2017 TaxID=2897299 RepID=UPI001F041C7E|nr:heme oxygenase-like [Xenia sp. Carnegie-2017]